MAILKWVLALAVGGFLVFFGYLKFSGAAFIFPYIEYKASTAGLPLADLAYPVGNWLVGATEIVAGLLVLLPFTRRWGALVGVMPFLGAVVIHLSPYLGTVTPLDFAADKPSTALAAGSGFVREHFTAETGNSLFLIAVGMFLVAIINAVVQRR
ncbi:MAG: hypothetical protein AAFW83_02725 [Pseudomonadota bacterium]